MEALRVQTVDGCDLAATLHHAGREQVIIWLHGISVDQDEHLGFFREGAQRFADKGVSSIRFDFRGHGESSGDSLDFSVVGQNLDVRAILNLAQQRFGSEPHIHVVGASFGAPPAIFAAARHPETVSSVSLIAPVLSYCRTFLKPETEWARELFSMEKLQQLDATGRLYFDSKFYIGHRLLEEMRLISPARALAGITQRVLVMHGDRDSMVPYDASVQACRGLPHVQLVTIAGADHGFMQEGDEEGNSADSLANKERVYQLVEEHLQC